MPMPLHTSDCSNAMLALSNFLELGNNSGEPRSIADTRFFCAK